MGLKIVIRNLAREIDFICQTKINELTSSDPWDMALFSCIILGQNVQVTMTSLKISSNIECTKAFLRNTEIGLIKY